MDMFSILSLEEENGKKDEHVKTRRTEVLAVGIAEDEEKKKKKNKKKNKKEKEKKKENKEKMEKKEKRKKKEREERSDPQTPDKRIRTEERKETPDEKERKNTEDNRAQAEDPLKQSTPMPLTDCSNAALFIRESQAVLVEARGINAGVFLDLCCGKGGVGKRAEAVHQKRAIRVDWASEDPSIIKCDLADPAIRRYIRTEIIDDDAISVAAMLHVPCDTFSSARHGTPGGRTPLPLRDYGENVWGLPGLKPRDQAKLEQGNKIARALLSIKDDLKKAGAPAGMENGDQSMLWKVPEMGAEDAKMLKVCYCMMGRPFRKRTRFLVWNAPSPRILEEEAHRCTTEFSCSSPKGLCRRTGEPHLILRGWVRGKALTKEGEKYPKKFVNMIARILCSPAEPAA